MLLSSNLYKKNGKGEGPEGLDKKTSEFGLNE